MIEKDQFNRIQFQSFGILEYHEMESKYKVQENWEMNNNLAELRVNIRDVMWDECDKYREINKVSDSDYNIIELLCRIPSDTLKKGIAGKYKVTRNFLAKFCVGLKLDVEKAESLFKQHSGELNLTNDFDYIVYHALLTKDIIDDFIEEVHNYLGINLDRDKV